MAKSHLSLILPDAAAVFANELNRALWPDALHHILNKARFQPDSRAYYPHLLALFSEPDQAAQLPIAQLRGGNANALCADPCYLHPDRDQLLLFYRDLDITLEEAHALADRIQPLLNAFQGQLQVISAGEWLLDLSSLPEVDFTPKEGLNGLPVSDKLPQGAQANDWIRLWNEIQMLLFECPENLAREQAGKVPINSLWFWGQGSLPALRPWPHVSGNDKVLAKLASESGSVYHAVVSVYQEIAGKQAIHMLTFEVEQDWQQQLGNLLDNWLLPAFQALRRGQLRELDIIIPEWGRYRLTPMKSWQLWK
jgi:hypothetical protein